MARRITLRKCSDHPDCQLQQIDGGEWEHTPASRKLADRISGRFDHARVKKDLKESLSHAAYLQRILEEERGAMGSLAGDLRSRIGELTKTLDAQAKANRAREYLDSQVKVAQEAGERLERAFQRADTEAGRQAAKLRELQAAEERIEQAERRAEEALALATEKLAQADTLLATLQERKVQLDGVDALYDLVDDVLVELRSTAAALQASDKETRRQIEHERRERLDATAKGLKSVQEHIRVSHA